MTWDRQSYRRLKNAIAMAVCTLMAVAAVLPLFAVLFHVARLGLPISTSIFSRSCLLRWARKGAGLRTPWSGHWCS